MTTPPIVAPKKLIEVALPLDEINKAAVREKSIRHGHPSTLHLWWARRPLAVTRAVLFAQLVNDPSWKYNEKELSKPQIKSAITRKRNELFRLIIELVQWENTTNEDVLERARKEIQSSWNETCEANKEHPDAATLFDPNRLPVFHDPFAGGGSIPLEAQRLGLEAHGSDLNPVAVLINKVMIEIPPKFAGCAPVGPIPKKETQTRAKATDDWSGAKGLAEDVRRYGTWMREEAERRIGHLYPKVLVTKEMAARRPDLRRYVGEQLAVIAWLWGRTVASPNPALESAHVPLVTSWILSKKAGREVWIEPNRKGTHIRFVVRVRGQEVHLPDDAAFGTKDSRGANFRCLISDVPITSEYIKAEGMAGRMGQMLLAIVCEGERERVYLDPNEQHEALAASVKAEWRPTTPLANDPRALWTPNYGLTTFGHLFTERQLVAMCTFADLIGSVRAKVTEDAKSESWAIDGRSLEQGGTGARAYGEAVATLLALAVSRLADRNCTICTWNSGPAGSRAATGANATTPSIRAAFARQGIPMTWDYAEASPFSDSGGGLDSALRWIVPAIRTLPARGVGAAEQAEAREGIVDNVVISTDPPYYDNIGYADLSDFFYVWLRLALRSIHRNLFSTLVVPKADELVANPYRQGGKKEAESFFLQGMRAALRTLAEKTHRGGPVTIYYAFKQSETKSEGGTASTGWETFLQAMHEAGFGLTGTWPMRTERDARSNSVGTNALASSIILVCRPRSPTAPVMARKDFLRQLEHALPGALSEMTADPEAAVAPVDLAQASIGPGMAIFSRCKAVLEANGESMTVHNALIHINKTVDDYFAQAEGDLDADTRFCIGWFQQRGFEPGPFGEADVLARAKGTAVAGVEQSGVLSASKGKVRLLRIKEYPKKWDPATDHRVPIWEACHQMCRALTESEGEAGALLARMPEKQDAIRQLAYRLYTICERQKWAEEARAYNELVTSWPAIVEESIKAGVKGTQLRLI